MVERTKLLTTLKKLEKLSEKKKHELEEVVSRITQTEKDLETALRKRSELEAQRKNNAGPESQPDEESQLVQALLLDLLSEASDRIEQQQRLSFISSSDSERLEVNIVCTVQSSRENLSTRMFFSPIDTVNKLLDDACSLWALNKADVLVSLDGAVLGDVSRLSDVCSTGN
jgi:hypothetical protein